jgi:hypothetical protein
MAKRSDHYREAVWTLLQDGQWHSILDLIQIGGVRAAARIHELRHEEGRRVLNRVVEGKSAYRYTCQCGPLPEDGPAACCELCRPVLAELGIEAEPQREEHQARQLGLFWRVA